MFEGQPKGLYALALANTGERFGYYTMIAVFSLFLRANFGLSAGTAGLIYSVFMGAVYFFPFLGGMVADKYGYGKMVTLGIFIMFIGYLLLAIPLGGDTFALIFMCGALLCVSIGTGLFKGNLQVMVGNLYDAPELQGKRDEAFSIFYMAINIGSLFAPTAAVRIMDWAQNSLGYSGNDAYHFAFSVACLSLVVSILIYYAFRSTFRHVEGTSADKANETGEVVELSRQETRERIIALVLVFAVVIFFRMAFQQNGLTLTFFADEFTAKSATGWQGMSFNVLNLVAIILIVYAAFALFQSKTAKARAIAGVVILASLGFLGYMYVTTGNEVVSVSAPIFQHFNPSYVVMLTPVSLAIFGYLARKGKEPSAPRKIAYGMVVAAAAYAIMLFGSLGLPTPDEQRVAGDAAAFVSPNWLMSTYLVLTFGELLLSPMGISFVSKVAPPKYKGAMMGGWFVATAIGNLLVSVGGFLWGGFPLWVVWGVFIVLCLLSAFFMMTMMKKLEKVC